MPELSLSPAPQTTADGAGRRLIRGTNVVVWLIAFGSLAFALTIYAGFEALNRINWQSEMRAHSFEVLVLIEATEGALVDMETAQRGYALTHDSAFLAPYVRGQKWMHTVFPVMRDRVMVQSSAGLAPPGDASHTAIDRLIDRRVAQLEAFATRAASGSGGALASETTSGLHDGEVLMDELRDGLDRMRSAQRAGIAANDATIAQVNARLKRVSALCATTGVLLLALSLYALSRERRKHERADAKLRSFNLALEATVNHRTQELRQAGERIRLFASALDRNIEAERRRLAREVHDQIGQVATGMKMIVMRLGQTHPELEHGPVRELAGLLDEAVATARHIAAELRPPLLDDLGFEAAVDHYASQSARQSGLTFLVNVTDDEILSAGQANQLFRILQEAVTNVLRHAHATEVEIHGAIRDGNYMMTVRDDGKGVQQMRDNSSGLLNMRERAHMAHGWLKLAPAEGGGTLLTASIPVDAEATV
ncbi:MAG: hypothetical protein JWQ11_414 [Rhizobacter sp.]|nr:hypothetical protein [Rhizobacter sp.]